MTKKPQQESFYELHLNKNDEVMISIHAKDGVPKSPVLLYDGGAHALLYRTPEQSILLDFIHPDARPCLAGRGRVHSPIKCRTMLRMWASARCSQTYKACQRPKAGNPLTTGMFSDTSVKDVRMCAGISSLPS